MNSFCAHKRSRRKKPGRFARNDRTKRKSPALNINIEDGAGLG
jgi:hypothetical protein